MSPPLCGAATSQTTDSTVTNNQVQLGDVFATQTLNVVTVSDSTSAVTTAVGNSLSGAVESGSVDVRSTQTVNNNVSGATTVNATGWSGAQVTMVTSATANTADAGAYNGGALTGSFTQTVGANNVTANSQYEGPTGEAGAMNTSAQAVANSQSIAVTGGGTATVAINQSSQALTQADGGAVLMYTPGTASFNATAISNNVTAIGQDGSSQALTINQSMTGTRTQASHFITAGNGQTVTGSTSAIANNISVSNETGDMTVTSNQDNQSYLRSQADVSSFQFGIGSATAYGVGNSVVAGNYGVSATIDNTQTNSGGGIDVVSNYTGDTGYDAYSSATAIGNAVTAYACSSCQGVVRANNSQTNSADIGATSTLSITGSNRSVSGVANAVGNSATFYVSRPGT